jgi:hypothetical protein
MVADLMPFCRAIEVSKLQDEGKASAEGVAVAQVEVDLSVSLTEATVETMDAVQIRSECHHHFTPHTLTPPTHAPHAHPRGPCEAPFHSYSPPRHTQQTVSSWLCPAWKSNLSGVIFMLGGMMQRRFPLGGSRQAESLPSCAKGVTQPTRHHICLLPPSLHASLTLSHSTTLCCASWF